MRVFQSFKASSSTRSPALIYVGREQPKLIKFYYACMYKACYVTRRGRIGQWHSTKTVIARIDLGFRLLIPFSVPAVCPISRGGSQPPGLVFTSAPAPMEHVPQGRHCGSAASEFLASIPGEYPICISLISITLLPPLGRCRPPACPNLI